MPEGLIQQDSLYTDIRLNDSYVIRKVLFKSGTRALAQNGEPLENIQFSQIDESVSPPSGTSMLCAIEMSPSGATFSIPIEVTIEYDPTFLPEGINEKDIMMASYNPETGDWDDCDFSLDSKHYRITANLSHFSLYAILGNGNAAGGVGWNLVGL
jgi:hypothetical protein